MEDTALLHKKRGRKQGTILCSWVWNIDDVSSLVLENCQIVPKGNSLDTIDHSCTRKRNTLTKVGRLIVRCLYKQAPDCRV